MGEYESYPLEFVYEVTPFGHEQFAVVYNNEILYSYSPVDLSECYLKTVQNYAETNTYVIERRRQVWLKLKQHKK